MPANTSDDSWRQTHLGRLAERARQRFDSRVLTLMAHDDELTLSLSHLAARGTLSLGNKCFRLPRGSIFCQGNG